METPVAIAYPVLGQVFQPHPYCSLLICHTLVPVGVLGRVNTSQARRSLTQ